MALTCPHSPLHRPLSFPRMCSRRSSGIRLPALLYKRIPTGANSTRNDRRDRKRGLVLRPLFACSAFLAAQVAAGQNGNPIQALELTGEDPSASVSSTRERASSQGGKVTPNVCFRRWHDKRELAGRLAGRGNSLVLMGIRWGTVKP